jgi:hypothetical protein
MRGDQADESFGLRHGVSSGVVSEVPEEDLRAGGGPGTSGEDGTGNMRGLRYRGCGDGSDGRAYPSSGIVPAITVDRGGREDHQKQQRTGVVPRVPGTEEETVGRGDMGRRIFRADGRRPDDSGRDCQVYRASSRVRARACAAGFEAALLMPRGLPRGH